MSSYQILWVFYGCYQISWVFQVLQVGRHHAFTLAFTPPNRTHTPWNSRRGATREVLGQPFSHHIGSGLAHTSSIILSHHYSYVL